MTIGMAVMIIYNDNYSDSGNYIYNNSDNRNDSEYDNRNGSDDHLQ